jgi:hypothetical protein
MKLTNIQLIEYIPDLLNVLILIFIFKFFIEKFNIKKVVLYYLIVLLIPLFFLNNFLFPWTVFPDQSKYAYYTYYYRNFKNFEIFSYFSTSSYAASFLLSLVPLPFITTINSIALLNRSIISALIIFFIKKKACPNFLIYILLFMPSVLLYSSLALREILILSTTLMCYYFFFEKKYKFSVIFLLILYAIKPYLAFIYGSLLIFYYILFIVNIKNIYKLYFFLCLSTVILYFSNKIFFLINQYKFGFESEIYSYREVNTKYFEVDRVDLRSIVNFFYEGIVAFFLSPINKINKIFGFFLFYETIFLYLILIFSIKYLLKINKIKAIFWIFSLLIVSSILGYVIISDGTLSRYKFQIIITFLFAMFFSIKKDVMKNNF